MMKNKTVVVGMSWGVDSSVAALLLKEEGYNVIGVTMQTMPSEKDHGIADAWRVARQLQIPHYTVDFCKEFKASVIDYFVREYRAGHTPNPCIACNRYIKWEALRKKGRELGADDIATGHYAKIIKLANGRYTLRRSDAVRKDQTYALYNLTQEQLAHTLFPLGGLKKEEIRAIAKEAHLAVAEKPDSQDICFVPDGDYAAFVERETGIRETPGNFIRPDGTILGTHKGIGHYTIGQRKGLGIALGEPAFVTEIRPATREVVLGTNEDVFTDDLRAENINYMAVEKFEKGQKVTAKIRYNHEGEDAVITEVSKDHLSLLFERPVRAVTPGQALVLYEKEYVLGGGVITK